MAMTKNVTTYEPPMAKVYRFDENDRILTESGGVSGGGGSSDPTTPHVDYAARALNELLGGTNTTIE